MADQVYNIDLSLDAEDQALEIQADVDGSAQLALASTLVGSDYIHPQYMPFFNPEPTETQYPNFGHLFTVQQVRTDEMGHVTDIRSQRVKMPNDEATEEDHGLMSAEDKKKLDALPALAIPLDEKGKAGGVAELDSAGKVPASQLPSYVDDVLEGYVDPMEETDGGTIETFYQKKTAIGSTFAYTNNYEPETGKIYVDLDTGKCYRWTGTLFAIISDYTHPTYTAYPNPEPIADRSPAFGGSVNVQQVRTDEQGHVTGITIRTITMPDSTASASKKGLMSETDKAKLDLVFKNIAKKISDTTWITVGYEPGEYYVHEGHLYRANLLQRSTPYQYEEPYMTDVGTVSDVLHDIYELIGGTSIPNATTGMRNGYIVSGRTIYRLKSALDKSVASASETDAEYVGTILDLVDKLYNAIAPTFDATVSYPKGSIVRCVMGLYRFTEDYEPPASAIYPYPENASLLPADKVEAVTINDVLQMKTEAADLDKYAPIDSPEFKKSISLNRKTGTAKGSGSIAVGNKNEAGGSYSSAFGDQTRARDAGQTALGRANRDRRACAEWTRGAAYERGAVVHIPAGTITIDQTEEYEEIVIVPSDLYLQCIKDTAAGDIPIGSDGGVNTIYWKQLPGLLFIIGNGDLNKDEIYLGDDTPAEDYGRKNAFGVNTDGDAFLEGDLYVQSNEESTEGWKVLNEGDFASFRDIDEIFA